LIRSLNGWASFAPPPSGKNNFSRPRRRDPVDFKGEAVSVDTLLAESDFLSMHLHSAENKGILNAARICEAQTHRRRRQHRPGLLIDTIALAAWLEENEIVGAALDVFEIEPLPADHPSVEPRCILTPHVAGHPLDASSERSNVADDVVRVLTGEPPLFPCRCRKCRNNSGGPHWNRSVSVCVQ
jgi:phosphoglycerate dehydrogenase-like enzyme